MILSLKHPRRGRGRSRNGLEVKGLLRNLYLNLELLGNYHLLSIFLVSNKCSQYHNMNDRGNWVHTGGCMVFTPEELCAATMEYNRKSIIGKGGFGTVYRGTVRGSLTVAIKVLNKVTVNVAVARCMHDYPSCCRRVQMQYWGQSLKVKWNQKSPTLHGINSSCRVYIITSPQAVAYYTNYIIGSAIQT